jgi:hypothetical protein
VLFDAFGAVEREEPVEAVIGGRDVPVEALGDVVHGARARGEIVHAREPATGR